MKAIIDIQVRGLLKRLEDRKIHVELTDAAKAHLVSEGYDPQYGARPLKRALMRYVQDPLAKRLLTGDFHSGDTILIAAPSAGVDELTMTRKPERRVAAVS
jgi:ATP-dependent Clp protease ATP-binding subunit ClpB